VLVFASDVARFASTEYEYIFIFNGLWFLDLRYEAREQDNSSMRGLLLLDRGRFCDSV